MSGPENREVQPPASSAPVKHDSWAFFYAPIHPRQTIARHLRGTLLAGMLTTIPLFVTAMVVAFIYRLVTTYTQAPADWLVTHFFGVAQGRTEALRNYLVEPALALAISLAFVYVLGLLGAFVIGRRLLAAGENFLSNLPLIKGIYGTTKQVIGVFRQGGGGSGFQRVVLVEFPRAGTWTVGFVTKTITDTARGEKFVCVFIPMTPNPTAGFFQLFPMDAVRETEWTVDQGLKILLSGGLLAPDEMPFGQPPAPPGP